MGEEECCSVIWRGGWTEQGFQRYLAMFIDEFCNDSLLVTTMCVWGRGMLGVWVPGQTCPHTSMCNVRSYGCGTEDKTEVVGI